MLRAELCLLQLQYYGPKRLRDVVNEVIQEAKRPRYDDQYRELYLVLSEQKKKNVDITIFDDAQFDAYLAFLYYVNPYSKNRLIRVPLSFDNFLSDNTIEDMIQAEPTKMEMLWNSMNAGRQKYMIDTDEILMFLKFKRETINYLKSFIKGMYDDDNKIFENHLNTLPGSFYSDVERTLYLNKEEFSCNLIETKITKDNYHTMDKFLLSMKNDDKQKTYQILTDNPLLQKEFSQMFLYYALRLQEFILGCNNRSNGDEIVYRGLYDVEPDSDRLRKTFSSVSTVDTKENRERFTTYNEDEGEEGCCLMVITLMRGVPYIDVFTLKKHTTDVEISEREWILPAGLHWEQNKNIGISAISASQKSSDFMKKTFWTVSVES